MAGLTASSGPADNANATRSSRQRTLYQYFPSKGELVESYLRTVDKARGTPVDRHQQDRTDLTAREHLLAIFDAPPVDRFRGCPFHNAAVESAGSWSTVDEIVRANKRRFAEQLVALAEEAGAADSYRLGHQLMVLFERAKATGECILMATNPTSEEHRRAILLLQN